MDVRWSAEPSKSELAFTWLLVCEGFQGNFFHTHGDGQVCKYLKAGFGARKAQKYGMRKNSSILSEQQRWSLSDAPQSIGAGTDITWWANPLQFRNLPAVLKGRLGLGRRLVTGANNPSLAGFLIAR
jgi:hypothetical protein